MKTKSISSLVLLLTLLFTIYSCKSEKKEEKEEKNETESAKNEVFKQDISESLEYAVSIDKSKIEWSGSKPTGRHAGSITITSGIISTENNTIKNGSFVIDMTSITVTDLKGEEKLSLEKHLKGEAKDKEDHFFNVAKFPEALFEITGFTEKEGKTLIEGDLTIKGIKKSISFLAKTKIDSSSFSLTSDPFTINRTDWGINYKSKSIFENLGDKFVNDDIGISINIIALPTM